MRKPFVESLLKHWDFERGVFLTGDLGFMALEPVREALGGRFINAGVAEQNMVSVAAGLAMSGLAPWVYSIAPFCYARPFEQIRNDVCLHRLPVRFVGNGGGYGYGVMGSTHHALEDYGVLLTLPGMKAFVPAFDRDLDTTIARMTQFEGSSYLRLGRCELPKDRTWQEYSPWRRLLDGGGPLTAVVGPLAGSLAASLQDLDEDQRPELWVVTELPVDEADIPPEFIARLERDAVLWAVEEHVAQGGFGRMLAGWALGRGLAVQEFRHFCARGYVSGRYGSQDFHRRESGIDGASVYEQCCNRSPRVLRAKW